jgi:phosphopantothenoylcysteine decarboxylase/phosphopantothenate--cysteine ligase
MQGKNIVLGVSGGIAAYKACELASRLTQDGARVHVVMTASAQRFVTPLTFQALTHQPVHTSLWPQSHESEAGVYAAMAHIALADEADAILVAPASANAIAHLAHGLADDLLTTVVLATPAPVLVSPAMNPSMLGHAATQKNLQTLRELGYTIIEPESGRMACEHVGSGRLPQTEVLIKALREALNGFEYSKTQDLAGKTVLVTAGPTREPVDAVRFISNRSSGKMGYALAEAAQQRGARVILVSGPTQLPAPRGVETIAVTTTQEMLSAVMQHAPECDIVIAAAAPADYRAAQVFAGKIKKSSTRDGILNLELQANPDIVGHVGQNRRAGQVIIGFAAETSSDIAEARRKLRDKHLDAIVLNDVTQPGAGFDVETNRVTWITADSGEEWPLLSKREVAACILSKAITLMER